MFLLADLLSLMSEILRESSRIRHPTVAYNNGMHSTGMRYFLLIYNKHLKSISLKRNTEKCPFILNIIRINMKDIKYFKLNRGLIFNRIICIYML